ncbi:IS110 family transposase, partial [Martelella alba]
PQFVKPYVKTNKNDAADAEAICEAVIRPTMRFVPVKTEEQQSILSIHRAREGFVKARTAQANAIRGLLNEFGIIIVQGIRQIAIRLPAILEDADNNLPGTFRQLLQRLGEHLQELDRQVIELEKEIQRWHRNNADSQRLSEIPGIGPITASALIASIGDVRNFSSGRQLAAWLGLVPRQYSSGGKPVLQSISKRGDKYLRTLLIHGARAVVQHIAQKTGQTANWLNSLLLRRNTNVAVVAVANKNVRIVWALLAHKRGFKADYCSTGASL